MNPASGAPRSFQALIFELQRYNPFLFDLIVKRNLSHRGKRFANAVIEILF